MTAFLPYSRQSISDADIDAVVEVLRSDYLTTGPYVDRFESDLAASVGAAEAVVCANGTAALHLSTLARNLRPRDAVIVPSVTFAATANCVAYCGARVIFADVDPVTGLMTDETFDEALQFLRRELPRYRYAGVIPVHYAGRPVGLNHIFEVSQRYGAFVLEDACHAFGSSGPDGRIGACHSSDAAVFSFHPVKTLTTAEGGAITTNDSELARKLRLLRSHGMERDPMRFGGLGYGNSDDVGPWVYEMQSLGFNYRLPDLNCALGLAQLKRLPEFIAKRQRLVRTYQDALTATNLPISWMPASDGVVFHLFAVTIDFATLGTTRVALMEGLRDRGIGSQVHYIPVHRHPWWQQRALGQRELAGSDQYYRNTLSLPLFVDMADDDPKRVVEAVCEILGS